MLKLKIEGGLEGGGVIILEFTEWGYIFKFLKILGVKLWKLFVVGNGDWFFSII